MEAALKEGYVHVDCAHVYGNEAEIGTALQKCFTEGVIKREDLFITSKLWYNIHFFYNSEGTSYAVSVLLSGLYQACILNLPAHCDYDV